MKVLRNGIDVRCCEYEGTLQSSPTVNGPWKNVQPVPPSRLVAEHCAGAFSLLPLSSSGSSRIDVGGVRFKNGGEERNRAFSRTGWDFA